MVYSVTIEKRVSNVADEAYQPTSVRLQIEVTAVTDFIDFGMFVYVIDPATNEQVYDHVAIPTDLQDYNYEIVGSKDYVRQKAIDRIYDTAEAADMAVASIEASLLDLCNDMTILDELGDGETTTITASV